MFSDQVWRLQLEQHEVLLALTKNVSRQQEEGRDVERLKGALRDGLSDAFPIYAAFIEQLREGLGELRKIRDEAASDERLAAEERLTEAVGHLQTVYRAWVELAAAMESLGLDVTEPRGRIWQRLCGKLSAPSGGRWILRGAIGPRRRTGAPGQRARSGLNRRGAETRLGSRPG